MNYRLTIFPLTALALLAACQGRSDRDANDASPESDTNPLTATPDPEAPVSIIRPDVEQPDLPEVPLEPLKVTIGFPEGGADLDASATAALEALVTSEQVVSGGPITLRAHSDAGGNDAANLRASQARGDKIRDWLTGKGIGEDRIAVIAFGEQNPAQPNALPDGSPNEAGRAANRRVDITVAPLELPETKVESGA